MTTEANAHFTTTVGPYLESFTNRITQINSNLSRMPDDLSGMTLYAVTNFDLRLPARFFGAAAKYHQAIGQTNYPLRYTIQTVANGGPGGAVLVFPAENWAALAPPDKTLPQVLIEAYGEAEAAEIMQQFGTSIRSQTSAVLRVRPDLSGN